MSSLLKGGAVLLVSACFAAPGSAQSTARAEAVTAPVKDAGILRLATGTWDRTNQSSLAIGANVLFNHNAPSGYYNPQDPNQEQVNEGRVPSNDPNSEGTAASYDVTCWQTAYCTDQVIGANVTADVRWFEQYNTCNNPDTDGAPGGIGPSFQVGCNSVTGLPGTAVVGTQACWIVTIDMTGTPSAFNLKGDGNGTLNGVQDEDSFGWGLHLNVTGGGGVPINTGLLLTGDPLNAPFGAGTDAAWGFAPGPNGTGLDEVDQFFVGDTTNASNNGCYWFGGYVNNHIWGGHWHQLIGDDNSGVPGSNYCTASLNSTGCASIITATGSASISANDLVLTANSLPTQPGIFIAGPTQAAVPLYCSTLCIGFGGLQRFGNAAQAGADGTITENVDYATSAPGGLNVMAGVTMNYQRWNRDPAGAGTCPGPGTPNTTATFSDAVSIVHTP
jgi:hypothetical protein